MTLGDEIKQLKKCIKEKDIRITKIDNRFNAIKLLGIYSFVIATFITLIYGIWYLGEFLKAQFPDKFITNDGVLLSFMFISLLSCVGLFLIYFLIYVLSSD